MSKNNIVLVGLIYDSNLGDQAIFQCTKRMLADCLQDCGASDWEVRELDMTGRMGEKGNDTVFKQLPFPLCRKILRGIGKVFHIKRLRDAMASYEISRATSIQCGRFCDEDTKAILFAGGGIIKYKYQYFHEYLRAIIHYAEAHGIPVMISAAGIEGYDEGNRNCLRLKAALISPCVKCITTRDDIWTLNELYCCGNTSIQTAQVADPACSMSRYFPRQKLKRERIIGLGVVREGLFTDNDIDFNKQNMLRFWNALYQQIEKAGYRCRLFSTGLMEDQQFALDLLRYMGIDDREEDVLAARPTSIEMLADTITSCSGVITGRLHASVIAYAYGVPSVGLVWNEKQVMFGKAIGCEKRFFRIETFEPTRIVQELLAAMEEGYDESAREAYRSTTAEEIRRFLKNVC